MAFCGEGMHCLLASSYVACLLGCVLYERLRGNGCFRLEQEEISGIGEGRHFTVEKQQPLPWKGLVLYAYVAYPCMCLNLHSLCLQRLLQLENQFNQFRHFLGDISVNSLALYVIVLFLCKWLYIYIWPISKYLMTVHKLFGAQYELKKLSLF